MEEQTPRPPRKRGTQGGDGEATPRARKRSDEGETPAKAPRKRAVASTEAATAETAPKTPRKRVTASTEAATADSAPKAPRKRAAPRAKAASHQETEAPSPLPAMDDVAPMPVPVAMNEVAAMPASPSKPSPPPPTSAPSTIAPGAAQVTLAPPGAAKPTSAAPIAPIAARSDVSAAQVAQAVSAPAPVAAARNAPRTKEARRERDTEPTFVPSFARPATPAPRARTAPRPADASPRSTRAIEWLCGLLPERHRGRARNYLVLMRLDRPIGALLLLWPTWWALWFAANDFPPPGALVIFTLGVFVMRSAGCVINDYADHGWLDAHVERTAGRPMAAGRVGKKEALALFGGLLAFAFVLVLFTNALTVKLSFVGAALAAIYPFTKRVTHLAQVVLGAAFGWSVPMAFAAVTGGVPALGWLLFLANVLWSTVYDTQYAMVDRDEDIRVGAKSTAILFGDADRAIVGVLMATFLLAMILAGTRAALHWPYFAGLAASAGLFGYQQWLMRDRSREHCFAAFRNNNWVGFALWLGLTLALALR